MPGVTLVVALVNVIQVPFLMWVLVLATAMFTMQARFVQHDLPTWSSGL